MATRPVASQNMKKMLARFTVISEIAEHKDRLFGPFDEDRTCTSKSIIWSSIIEKAKSLGLVAPSKNYKYMRDVYWQNIKRNALSKRENKMIHGKRTKITPIDELVYDIIDNTSSLHTQQPAAQIRKPLRVYERSVRAPKFNCSVDINTDDDVLDVKEDIQITEETVDELEDSAQLGDSSQQNDSQMEEFQLVPDTDHRQSELIVSETEIHKTLVKEEPPQIASEPSVSYPFNSQGTEDEYNRHYQKMEGEGDILKKQKVRLEIKNLKLQNYKIQLEVLQLERKLGIQPSKLTQDLARKRKFDKLIFEDQIPNGEVSDDSDVVID